MNANVCMPLVQVAVCTPGRMIDLIKMKACNMLRATYLVFDEADRMFDMGFEPQVSAGRKVHKLHSTPRVGGFVCGPHV